MATTRARIPPTVENLLDAVKHLSPAELHEFQRQFTARSGEKNGRNGTSSPERDEEALLAAIRDNSILRR